MQQSVQLEDFTMKFAIAHTMSYLAKFFGVLWILDYFGLIQPFIKIINTLY